jgi:two-component system, OmpR family, response regulator
LERAIETHAIGKNTRGGQMVAFLDTPGRPLSRAYLLQAIQASEDVFDRSIDVRVMRLRRALQRSGAPKRLIKTESGIGYVFDAVVERLY